MLVDKLRVGLQVTREEQKFVKKVVAKIRAKGYDGPIEVIGSREKYSRISVHAFDAYCHNLPSKAQHRWLEDLNIRARDNHLSAGEIRKTAKFLPKNTPPIVLKMLQNAYHPDADLDLAIKENIPNLQARFDDKPCFKGGSGLVIDIFPPDWEPEHSIFDY